jgi:hypothetical protein
MPMIMNLYIQKLLLGKPVTEYSVLIKGNKKSKFPESYNFVFHGLKYTSSFGNVKVDERIKFSSYAEHEKCIAIFILLESKRNDIIIGVSNLPTINYFVTILDS